MNRVLYDAVFNKKDGMPSKESYNQPLPEEFGKMYIEAYDKYGQDSTKVNCHHLGFKTKI